MPIAGDKKRQHDELRTGPLDHLFLNMIYGVTVEEVKGSIQKQQVAEFKKNLRDMKAKGKNHWDIMKRIGQIVADMNAPPPPTWTDIAVACSLETLDEVGKEGKKTLDDAYKTLIDAGETFDKSLDEVGKKALDDVHKTLDDVHKTFIDVGETFDKALESHLDGVNLNLQLSFRWKAAGNDDSTYASTYASSQPNWFKARRDDETIFCDDCDDTNTKASTDDSSFVTRRTAGTIESRFSEKWLQRFSTFE